MLKSRVIPMLLLRNGRMVKGVQFDHYRDVGDPVSAARIYNAQYADELIFLDINQDANGFDELLAVIGRVSRECFMPLTVGGGIDSVDKIRALLAGGADKIVINTAAFTQPQLIQQAAAQFGQQCLVIAVDLRYQQQQYCLYSHCGRTRQAISLGEHLQQMQRCGAGEFLLNSIDRDGSKQGYDLALLAQARHSTQRPLILAGGAGHFMHLVEGIRAGAQAVACASVFHFADNNPLRARAYLHNQGIAVKRYK